VRRSIWSGSSSCSTLANCRCPLVHEVHRVRSRFSTAHPSSCQKNPLTRHGRQVVLTSLTRLLWNHHHRSNGGKPAGLQGPVAGSIIETAFKALSPRRPARRNMNSGGILLRFRTRSDRANDGRARSQKLNLFAISSWLDQQRETTEISLSDMKSNQPSSGAILPPADARRRLSQIPISFEFDGTPVADRL